MGLGIHVMRREIIKRVEVITHGGVLFWSVGIFQTSRERSESKGPVTKCTTFAATTQLQRAMPPSG